MQILICNYKADFCVFSKHSEDVLIWTKEKGVIKFLVFKSENFKAEICRQLDDLYFFFTLIVFSCYSLSFQILFSVKLWRGLSLLSISKGILFIYFSNRYYLGKNIITYDIITNVIKTEHLHNMKHFQYI